MSSALHGHTTHTGSSPTYKSWHTMKQRCTNPRNPQYKDYGGRGITLDPRWEKFSCFLADMGVRPEGTTLDRIDNNLGYGPSNCRWVSRKLQQRNRRTNRWITHNGETKLLTDWATQLGIRPHTLSSRLDVYGWSIEKALTKPKMRRGQYMQERLLDKTM